jgi:hypothetical protein
MYFNILFIGAKVNGRELKVRSRIGIAAVILVIIGIVGMLAFIYSVESTRTDRILDATINCISSYGRTTECIQICEGTLNNTGYHDMRLLDDADCEFYINDVADR